MHMKKLKLVYQTFYECLLCKFFLNFFFVGLVNCWFRIACNYFKQTDNDLESPLDKLIFVSH